MDIVKKILELVLSLLPEDKVKELLDVTFDAWEKKIVDSPAQWDDAVILPLIRKARQMLNVPDDDNIG